VYALVFLIPELFGRSAIVLRTRVYFTWPYFGLGCLFFVSMLLGAFIGRGIIPNPVASKRREEFVANWYMDVLAIATIGAYLIWFRGIFTSPSQFLSLFTGQGVYGNVRDVHKTIGGVTTLTQCGIAYVVLYLDHIWCVRAPFSHKRFHYYFLAIIALALFRVYVWAERLALIELVVPMGLMLFCYRAGDGHVFFRTIRCFGPVIGVVVLALYFAITEFYRSWNAHYQFLDEGFASFAQRRFLTYYYSALNNGAGLLEMLEWPTYEFDHILQWVYRFPALIGPIFRYAFDVETLDYRFLARYADPEFNNMSGVFTVFYDVGVAGASIYALVIGCLAGASYRGVVERRGFLRLFFPLMFMAIIESMRLVYLSEPRAFPAILAIAAGWFLFRQPKLHQRPAVSAVRPGRLRVIRRLGLVGRLRRGF
jgi:oligosaccharide repeat unit polymerase